LKLFNVFVYTLVLDGGVAQVEQLEYAYYTVQQFFLSYKGKIAEDGRTPRLL